MLERHYKPLAFLASGSKEYDDLLKKGQQDQARHKEKIRDAVKKNLPQIIGEEAIVSGDSKKIIKVPIRGIELPRFRFGNTQGGESQGPGKGKQAGDLAGEDYYEVGYEIGEIEEMFFEELGLPWLQPKGTKIKSMEMRFDEIARRGIMPNVSKRDTIKANIMRNAKEGRSPKFHGLIPDDLRYRTMVPVEKPESSAVVVAMRDDSGSMGEFEKTMTRTGFKWMVRFLRKKYDNVEMVFITHHTEAKERNEEEFFNLGESGGTKVSSAYQLGLEIIDKRYPPSDWNIYPYHFSDGENWDASDNQECIKLVEQYLNISNMFGYAEIRKNPNSSASTLMTAFSKIKNPRFVSSTIQGQEDIYPTLKKFFPKDKSPEGAVNRI